MMQCLEPQLFRQYALLDPCLVRGGQWASLWAADRGPAVSLLPVLALLGRGYPAGAASGAGRLQDLCGLSAKGVARAFDTLSRHKLVEVLEARRGIRRFRVCPKVFATAGGLRLQGRLIASGLWSSLTAGERGLLMALAGRLTTRKDPEALPDDVVAWFEGLGVVEEDEYFPDGVIWRVGFLTHPQMQKLSGLPPAGVLASLELAARRANGSLLVCGHTRDGCWIHLPNAFWGWSRWEAEEEDGEE